MFCKHCGYEVDEQTIFCPKCGKRIEEEMILEEKTENPIVEEKKSGFGGGILGCAIASLIFAVISFIFFMVGLAEFVVLEEEAIGFLMVAISFPIVGWILAGTARKKARDFEETYGETEGKATVGKHLALPALIICIVIASLTALFIIASI